MWLTQPGKASQQMLLKTVFSVIALIFLTCLKILLFFIACVIRSIFRDSMTLGFCDVKGGKVGWIL